VLSCAIGNALYPHRQWAELAATWRSFYPTAGLDERRRRVIASLEATIGSFVGVLLGHHPASLRGARLGDAIRMADRAPDRLLAAYDAWTASPRLMREAPPTLVFAVLGRARAKGRLSPEREDRLLGSLITQWAVRSTLDVAELCARVPATARPARAGVAAMRPVVAPIATGPAVRLPARRLTPARLTSARPAPTRLAPRRSPQRPTVRRRQLQPSVSAT
jgi:hypothetical protein